MSEIVPVDDGYLSIDTVTRADVAIHKLGANKYFRIEISSDWKDSFRHSTSKLYAKDICKKYMQNILRFCIQMIFLIWMVLKDDFYVQYTRNRIDGQPYFFNCCCVCSLLILQERFQSNVKHARY